MLSISREAGFNVKEIIYVRKTNSKCYLSSFQLSKVKSIVQNNSIKKLCVYDELRPRHVTCLMKELGIEVIDKVLMILTVFQNHAGSREALLQIEMARLKHQLPLIRDWIRRIKAGELPGFLSLGRYAVDIYYRHITRRIAKISEELEKLRIKRSHEREKRKKQGFIHVAIVGYTNAGKTTLFNTLTNLVKPTGIEMFTTLSPKSYMIRICGINIVVTDTIGFIKNIPIGIIEAFRAVLEEISDADVVLLVIDGSKVLDQVEIELKTSLNILKDIGALGKPLIIALNKIDVANDANISDIVELIKINTNEYKTQLIDVITISALKRYNIDLLKDALCRTVQQVQRNLV
ncbi:MAG: GTPase HflX [Ignisphaera sp.]